MKGIVQGILFGAFLFAFIGCSTAKAITHYFKSTDRFHPVNTDQRILYEPGAEKFAELVSISLPDAIKIVEKGHYSQFTKDIKIYVCATPESFEDMTGRTVKAITYRKSVFLSPRLMEYPETVSSYLTHELSHLIMVQHMSLYRFVTMPPWFSEGLAVYISEGGGAGDVTETEAIETILAGKHFEPHDDGGILDFLFPKYGSHWGLKPHMFYRQSMLFVSFMKEYDKEAFKNLILNMYNGQTFAKSFQYAYNISTEQMWHMFTNQLKENKGGL
jgi:hypothetical protein